MLTTREAAARLGVHERTVRRAIARGELAAVKQHGAYIIPATALDRLAPTRLPPNLVALPSYADGVESLPEPLTPLIGRVAERAEIAALLRDNETRLATLIGPGGIGKTRLAIAVAGDLAAAFSDGVVFVDLAAITRDEFVLSAIAAALALKESARQDLKLRVRAFLRPRRILLVLDNLEHLLSAAPLIAELLTYAPGLAVLATSRIPLRIRGEREVAVPALSIPSPDRAITAGTILDSEAGRLFVERARGVDAAFALDDAAAAAVRDICARLDGLPLAIELAAARVKTLAPHQLRDRLDRRLPLLTSSPRDAPKRHLTMRDAIAWSYELLSQDEQDLFRLLAVFVDGCTLQAAEWVGSRGSEVGSRESEVGSRESGVEGRGPGVGSESCSSDPRPPTSDLHPPTPDPVLDLVASLVAQSLLVRERGLDGEPRFRMLETIREFGLERLEERGETAAARNAHAAAFLALARNLRPLANTRATDAPLDRLTADEANVRATLAWLDQHGPGSDFVCMVTASYTFLFALSHFREAETWLNRAQAVLDEAAAADRARLVLGIGELHMVQGDFARANLVLADALTLMRAHGDPFDLAMALSSRGASYNYGGDYEAAEPFFQEALAVSQAIADPTLRAAVAARALANFSISARGAGTLGLAAARGEAALELFRAKRLELGEARILIDLGDIARDQGDHRLAVERYQACLARSGERSELRLAAAALEGIAAAAAAWGQERTAVLLFGAAAGFRDRTGFGMVLQADVAALDRALGALRAALGDREVDASLAEGHALALADARRLATAVSAPEVGHEVAGDSLPPPLTSRERDVLRLLVARRTDREIAAALFLSPRTVQWHVASILGKLGTASRREAAALATSRGLA